MRILITGGAGFVGHHVVESLLKNTTHQMVLIDRLDVSGNLNRLEEVLVGRPDRWRVKFVFHDLKAPINAQLAAQIGRIDAIVHMAASTHVDRSIIAPLEFVYDNVVGTANLLEYARQANISQMVYFSTDEVFGPSPMGAFREWDRYRSGNPYAATKAGAEELCIAYHNTYGLPVMVTHCMNIFGERQHPEKFIPKCIIGTRDGHRITIHANKERTAAGSRSYIHARNVADALIFLLQRGQPGEKYNIVGEQEVDNLTLAKMIADLQGKPLIHEMVDFHSARPGHDLRYALDGGKMAIMGWRPPMSFADSLKKVVSWTLGHPRWLAGATMGDAA